MSSVNYDEVLRKYEERYESAVEENSAVAEQEAEAIARIEKARLKEHIASDDYYEVNELMKDKAYVTDCLRGYINDVEVVSHYRKKLAEIEAELDEYAERLVD